MKNVLILLCLILIILTNNRTFSQIPPHSWSAAIKVISEDDNTVAGASVTITYDLFPMSRNTGKGFTWGQIKGFTDTNGVFTTFHTDNSFNLGITVEKAGYYPTRTGYSFYFDKKRQHPSFTLLLKKIGMPIAMYAKREEAKVPKENEPIGFDLVAGDWVAPYGVGKTADLLFTVHRQITSPQKFDADMELTFPHAGDGIVVQPPATDADGISQLLMPHSAPETGYQSSLTWSYHNFNETSEPASGYFFRVRTALDSNGNVQSALYGKIQGDVRFLVGTRAPRAAIAFTYYLNPTPNSRNVEFDPKQDLLGGLPFDARVKEP